tara:strand:+ start:18494 stop:18652 length:159 start_codon:yes stop_codon:yes gene_type:complete
MSNAFCKAERFSVIIFFTIAAKNSTIHCNWVSLQAKLYLEEQIYINETAMIK